MPPPAPRTVTLDWRAAEEENWRAGVTSERAAERANMAGGVVVVENEDYGEDEGGVRRTRAFWA